MNCLNRRSYPNTNQITMLKHYNKLVRDKIPDVIRQAGKRYETEAMPEGEYIQALLQKVVEEAQEVAAATPEDLAFELADLQEVVDAIMAVHAIGKAEVTALQASRRVERGGFNKRLKLLWTE